MSTLDAARAYVGRGFAVTPTRGKRPILRDWQTAGVAEAELPRRFTGEVNVGVLNGSPSGGLVDIDLDAPEALAVADAFLPETGLVFGRASKPGSHRFHLVDPPIATVRFKDVDGAMLVELRSSGTQTIWPPSRHPSGETIGFDLDGEPAMIDGEALRAAVSRVAACALLAKRWPKEKGSRHTLANAVAGFVLCGGGNLEIAVALIEWAAFAARDEEWSKRGDDGRSTAKALAAGKKVSGGPTVAELIGVEAVAQFHKWLGLRGGPAEKATRAVIVSLYDVEPEKVRWIDRGRIPLGKLTVLDGDPSLGKSTIALDYAARVSTGGPMPDGSPSDLEGPAGVVILSAEDGLADTIRPRLEAAGADTERIVALTAVAVEGEGDRLPTLADISAIEIAIAQVAAKLLIVDPLMAYMPSTSNAHHDQDVRRILAALSALAERTAVAVLVVRHLNKAVLNPNPLYRGGGSIGIIGAARSGLLVAADPDDELGRDRVLASIKCNLAPKPPALAYHLESPPNGVARVVWDGEVAHATIDLLRTASEEDVTKLDRAKDFLRQALKNGRVAATELKSLAKADGIAERTLDRAKAGLGIKAEKDGKGGWWWEDSKAAKTAKVAKETKDAVAPRSEEGGNGSAVITPDGQLGHLGSVGTLGNPPTQVATRQSRRARPRGRSS